MAKICKCIHHSTKGGKWWFYRKMWCLKHLSAPVKTCSTNRPVSFPLSSPPSRKGFEDCWIHQWYSVLPAEPITIRRKVGPTTACVQKLSLTLILYWNFIPQQRHSCQQESRLPCCSGDLPAGSSLVTSSGTHRLCNSRVSTDRHRQNARQPLEGRHDRMEHGNKSLDMHGGTLCNMEGPEREK